MLPSPLNGMLLALNSARLISALPKASFTAGARKVPDELSDERICEWVAVSSTGERVAAQTVEGEGYYRMTAAATVVFADALVGKREKGLRGIEQLVSLSELRSALGEQGVSVRKRAISDGSGG
jgi:hypothetical protein